MAKRSQVEIDRRDALLAELDDILDEFWSAKGPEACTGAEWLDAHSKAKGRLLALIDGQGKE
jgi:hypothetical protein